MDDELKDPFLAEDEEEVALDGDTDPAASDDDDDDTVWQEEE